MNVASVLQDCLLICSPFKLSCYLGMKSLPPSGFGKHCANLRKSMFSFEKSCECRSWSGALQLGKGWSEGRFSTQAEELCCYQGLQLKGQSCEQSVEGSVCRGLDGSISRVPLTATCCKLQHKHIPENVPIFGIHPLWQHRGLASAARKMCFSLPV